MNKMPKKKSHTVRRLLSYVGRGYLIRFFLVLVCILVSAVASVAGSIFLGALIDNYITPLLAMEHPVFTGLLHALLLMACLYVVGALCALAYNRLMVTISQGVQKKIRDDLAEDIRYIAENGKDPAKVAAAKKYLETYNDGEANQTATAEFLAVMEAKPACDCERYQRIMTNKDFLNKKSCWIFGGDGWAYDIGFGGLDHVLAQDEDVNVFVFNTEVYSNTGGQASKASNIGQVAQFAAAGKELKSKSLAEIAMSYGYIYVAQVAMGANPAQTIKAIKEAEAYPGPSLIIGYAPCEMHSIKKGGMTNCQGEMKRAVDCGYWNLFRYDPSAEKPFALDSKEPAGGYRDFLMNEARYARLTNEFPERAEELFAKSEVNAKARYEHLLKLKQLYDEA